MIDMQDSPSPDDQVIVRPFAPADRDAVERLFHEGLLPGYVDYNPQEAEQIRAMMAAGRQRMWVADADGQVVGTIALIEAEPGVGQIHWLRVESSRQADLQVIRQLRAAVAVYAREAGLLKLVLQAPRDAEARVVDFYKRAGFVFSRARDRHGRHLLELYVDLYHRTSPRKRSTRK